MEFGVGSQMRVRRRVKDSAAIGDSAYGVVDVLSA